MSATATMTEAEEAAWVANLRKACQKHPDAVGEARAIVRLRVAGYTLADAAEALQMAPSVASQRLAELGLSAGGAWLSEGLVAYAIEQDLVPAQSLIGQALLRWARRIRALPAPGSSHQGVPA